ncbi:MAG TPA: ABC transporter ATP-binding protein [Micromonosporaceae bacterium]|nr:ABC transporter ATP-binding protein [Micromonosporaceae bacterium]
MSRDRHQLELAEADAGRRWRVADLRRVAAFGLRLAWGADRRRVLLVFGLQATQAVGLGAALLMLREVLGGVLAIDGDGARPAMVALSVAVLLGMGLVGAVLEVVARAQEAVLALKIQREATDRVVRAAAGADLVAFERPEFHDRVERAVWAAEGHAPMLLALVLSTFQAALSVLAVGVALVVVAWWLLPLLLVAALPSVRVALLQQRTHYALQVALMENRRVRSYLVQLLTGRDEAKEVRAFGLAGLLGRRLESRFAEAIEREGQFQRRFAVRVIAARVAGDLVIAAAVVGLLVASAAGYLELAAALSALGGVYLVSSQAGAIPGLSSMLGGSVRFVDDLREFTASAPAPVSSPPVAARPFKVLEADRVSFTYPAATRPALSEVSIRLEAGEVVALVGVNGSGKTTLAKVLTGLYRPDTGAVTADGEPGDPAGLRAVSAVLFQDFLRYKLTAADNIGLGRPDRNSDLARVRRAARQAGADALVEALPQGYDTVLSTEFTGGADLSLGQWQRVALARAFFRDAPFVVLDEPTAALDPRAESALFASVRRLLAGRTVLLISHRFSSVRSADRIYVLDAGRVVEHGTHDALLARAGLYAELFTAQAAAYLDPARGPAPTRPGPARSED